MSAKSIATGASCILAADDASATRIGKHVGWNTAGRIVFVAVGKHFSVMIPVEGGKVDKLEKNEGRFAEAWVRCTKVFCVFCPLFFGSRKGGHCEMRL